MAGKDAMFPSHSQVMHGEPDSLQARYKYSPQAREALRRSDTIVIYTFVRQDLLHIWPQRAGCHGTDIIIRGGTNGDCLQCICQPNSPKLLHSTHTSHFCTDP